MPKTFSPQLNLRTAYNFQESVIKIEDYVSFAVHHKFPYLFYADKFVMYGAAEFTEMANRQGIKPIIGLTLEIDSQIIILIAKDDLGYRHLSYISSLTIDKQFDTWAALKATIQNQLTSHLLAVVNWKEGTNLLDAHLPQDNIYYFEKLPIISYLHADQKPSLSVVLALKQGTTVDQLSPTPDQYYLSDQELEKMFDLKQYQLMTDQIAQQVKFNLLKTTSATMMVYSSPSNLSPQDFLVQLTTQSLNELFAKKELTQEEKNRYQKRLDYELEIIHRMGFDSYFLVVWDYVKYAQEHGILVGPGRGSAASSLVSYLLNITAIDPLEYNLYFERFLNPERRSLPDIDIDFQDDRRNEVVEYLVKKYGKHHVALVGTFQTIGAKLAIRDAGRALGINLEDINIISKNLAPNLSLTNFERELKNNSLLKAYSLDHPTLFQVAKDLIGLPRQTGVHAAGLVMTKDDLRDFVPLKLSNEGFYQTQYDMTFLEDLGLIKMDLLGLKNLSILKTIQENIAQNQGKKLDYKDLPLDDQTTFALLNKKQTSGIFQLESPGMTQVLGQVQVNSIQDISDVSALFRPGPQEMIKEYVANKKQKSLPKDRIHKALALVLEDTHGVMVYQEQVLQVLQEIANFSLGKADLVRRAMSKKDHHTMQKSKDEFMASAIKNGYQKQEAQEIWNWIEQFAGYGFNKSHSIAYSYLSYWLAYYKTHYPLEFYGALLTNTIGNEVKTSQYLQEAQSLGLQLVFPNLKNMSFGYALHQNKLYLPLTLIKGISFEFVRKLKEQYQKDNHLFDSIFHLMSRLVNNGLNTTTFPALVWSGAFDFFGHNRETLIANQRQLFDFANLNIDGQIVDETLAPEMLIVPEDKHKVNEQEKKYLGFNLQENELVPYRQKLKDSDLISIKKAQKVWNNKQRILGEISKIKIVLDRKQKPMAFITLKDESGVLEATIFSSLYPKFKSLIRPNQVVIAEVTIQTYQQKPKATIWSLEAIDLS